MDVCRGMADRDRSRYRNGGPAGGPGARGLPVRLRADPAALPASRAQLLLRLTGDRPLAEDLAQETFVKAFRSLAGFDVTAGSPLDSPHRPQHGYRRAAAPQAPPFPSTTAAPPRSTRRPSRRRRSGRACRAPTVRWRPRWQRSGRISVRQSRCGTKTGSRFEEIGQVLGIPDATARSHVHRARKALGPPHDGRRVGPQTGDCNAGPHRVSLSRGMDEELARFTRDGEPQTKRIGTTKRMRRSER